MSVRARARRKGEEEDGDRIEQQYRRGKKEQKHRK
jgi:hypothetical protein